MFSGYCTHFFGIIGTVANKLHMFLKVSGLRNELCDVSLNVQFCCQLIAVRRRHVVIEGPIHFFQLVFKLFNGLLDGFEVYNPNLNIIDKLSWILCPFFSINGAKYLNSANMRLNTFEHKCLQRILENQTFEA